MAEAEGKKRKAQPGAPRLCKNQSAARIDQQGRKIIPIHNATPIATSIGALAAEDKTFSMKLSKPFTYYLSADTIVVVAQNLYDNKNFRGLTADETIMWNACVETFERLRPGEKLMNQLEYNCAP